MHRLRLLAALSLGLAAASPARAEETNEARIERLWQDGRGLLEPAGITRAVFAAEFQWHQLQYTLGACERNLPPGEVAYWRSWWDDTRLMANPAFRRLHDIGQQGYAAGSQGDGTADTSPKNCRRVVDHWARQIRGAVAVVEEEQGPLRGPLSNR